MTATTVSELLPFRAERREPRRLGASGEQGGFPIGYGFRGGVGTPCITRTVQRAAIGRITDIGKIRANGNSIQILIPFQ